MASQPDSGGKDDVKTQFVTREGTYRLMTLAEYSRPNRVACGGGNCLVRVSLVSLPTPPDSPDTTDDRICFNYGKELYVYVYRGTKKAADLTKPVDKKVYKGTNPTCHDFNTVTMTSESVSLVIGFSTGQIQMIDPIKKEICKLYNEERVIDKTRVTCIKWVPGSSNLFVAAHASGHLYVYDEELPTGPATPQYTLHKQGEGYTVHASRSKTPKNPLYKWSIADAALNEFAFSPCGANLAIVAQDGFLRVFHYDSMELVGRARSYFGGFLCVCWSPDGRYVVVGGEDDLVTVWCMRGKRVVARGQGHKSWVSVVAFDPYVGGDCYRLGSVSQDTQLCLWDLSEDVLRPPVRARASAHLSPASTEHNGLPARALPETGTGTGTTAVSTSTATSTTSTQSTTSTSGGGSLAQRLAGFSFGERRSEQRRHAHQSASKPACDPLLLMGTAACPRFDECPVLEPLVCKKVAHERLTALLFRADYFVTACADGAVNTWARPRAHDQPPSNAPPPHPPRPD